MTRRKPLLILVLLCAAAAHVAPAQPLRVTAHPTRYHFLANDRVFFPLGYYITTGSLEELPALRAHGVNTVILYYYAIADHYRTPPFTGSYFERYLRGLRPYLDALRRNNITAIVDLQAKLAERDSNGFSADGILRIVRTYKSHPAVFGWLLEEEGYHLFRTHGHPTWQFVRELKRRVNAEDPLHPVVFVETNTTLDSTSFFGEGPSDYHGNELYDILGYDKYVFDGRKGREDQPYSDENLVSREAVHRIMPHIAAGRKHGLIFIAQCVDRSRDIITPGSPPLTRRQVWYQSLSPIIRGARGVLYWWRQTDPVVDYHSSPATLRMTDGFISWFTRFGLADVIARGVDRKNTVRLSSTAGTDSLTVFSKDAPTDSSRIALRSYRWEHYNNYGYHKNTGEGRFARHHDPSLSDPDFVLFDFIVRQVNNSYYLFIANDYRLRVASRLVLDRMVPQGRRITRAVELMPSGDLRRVPVIGDTRAGRGTIEVRMEGHSVKVIRVETGVI